MRCLKCDHVHKKTLNECPECELKRLIKELKDEKLDELRDEDRKEALGLLDEEDLE